MKRTALIFILLTVLLTLPVASHAQSAKPVIILMEGDLWAVDGTALINLTHSGYLQEAALSPDGNRIAYSVWSPISVAAVEQFGGIGGGPLPADIAVLDLTTLESATVAPQPADALFFADSTKDSALLRSAPTWSPDGSRLAWGELHYPSNSQESNRLMVYDFAAGTTRVLASHLPQQAGIPQPVYPLWGGAGIAFLSADFNPETTTFPMSVALYDPQDGRQIAFTPIPDSDSQIVASAFWVNTGGKQEIAIQYASARWDLLEPVSGALRPAPVAPERYSTQALNSAAVAFTYYPDAAWPDYYSWTITYPDGRQVAGQNRVSDIARVTLSPDGQTLAQVTTGGLLIFLMPDGQVLEGPALADAFATVFWGPTAWRISQPAACGSALPPRLVVGGIGILSPTTTPNRVRATPATGKVIGQLRPGEEFSVLAGPECANGMTWWQVDNGHGLVGWTAEGDSREYWLEPATG